MRNIVIDETNLKNLLASRSMYIGGSLFAGIGLVVGGINTLYEGWPSGWLQIILGAILFVTGAWQGIKSFLYDDKKLLKEILNMDKTQHHHSIIAIKDTFQPYPNRFLVYEDTAWNCRFFPNFPTQETEKKNKEYIKEKLSNELKIPESCIAVERKGSALQEKYSVKHQENRIYDHIFYLVTLDRIGKAMQRPSFTLDNRSFYWMTISEMEADPDIQKKNMDVVREVNRLIP